MTIGIAAVGPHAVSVVMEALRATETLGAGAIGGFAVLVVLDHKGVTHSCETQSGGSEQLSFPTLWLSYERAAIISSGPNRPAPLIRFLPSQDGVGLVTGHRLPNRDFNGTPLNVAALQQLAQGQTAHEAIATVLDACPECDAGLIALSAAGELAMANSSRVERRLDMYATMHEHSLGTVALLMNSIAFPAIAAQADPAALITQIAARRFNENSSSSDFLLALVDEHCQLMQADHDLVVINTMTRRVVRIDSADSSLSDAIGRRTIIQNGTPVVNIEGAPLGLSYNDVIANIRTRSLDSLAEYSSLGLVIGPQP